MHKSDMMWRRGWSCEGFKTSITPHQMYILASATIWRTRCYTVHLGSFVRERERERKRERERVPEKGACEPSKRTEGV